MRQQAESQGELSNFIFQFSNDFSLTLNRFQYFATTRLGLSNLTLLEIMCSQSNSTTMKLKYPASYTATCQRNKCMDIKQWFEFKLLYDFTSAIILLTLRVHGVRSYRLSGLKQCCQWITEKIVTYQNTGWRDWPIRIENSRAMCNNFAI